MFLRKIVPAFVALALTGCAGAGRVYQADSVKPMKNVAIAGIDVVQPAEFDPFKAGDDHKGPGGMASTNFAVSKPSQHVADYYNDLREALKSRYKWTMPAPDKVIGNATYKKYHHDTTSGFQSAVPIQQGMAKFSAPNTLDFDAARKLDRAGRDALIDALKVDAIIFAEYTIELTTSGVVIMGIGSRYPQTKLQFAMYKKGQDAPVWQDRVEGEKMADSIGKTAISLDFAKMQSLSLKSAKKAYAELDTRTSLPQ